MRSVWLLAALAMGCSGGDDPTDGKTTDNTTETGTTTDTTDTVPPTGTLGTATLNGTVSNDSGPMSAVQLRLCRGAVCRNGATDASGGFEFGGVPEEWHSFEIVPPAGSGLATSLVPLTFGLDEVRTVDVRLLPLDPPSALGATAAEHAVGAGLYLTLALGDLEPPLFVDEATEVAGARIPDASWVPTDGLPGTVVAQWYLSPFDHHAIDAGGIPVRISDGWGLSDGQTLHVWVGSYEDSAWLDAGVATAYGGQLTGAALPLLSTVVVTQE